jgi:periplasmic divalent cation tolerance protein
VSLPVPDDLRAGEILIGFCTVPDRDSAERIAHALVTERLAACVNIIPQVVSVYRWEGKVEQSEELLLLIKTTRQVRADLLRDRLLTLHPYDVPEFLLVPVASGLDKYVAWVTQSVGAMEGEP